MARTRIDARMPARLGAAAALGLLLASAGAAAAEICVRNAYEVPWVHPGITFYLTEGAFACDGIEMPLVKTGETRCAEAEGLAPDAGWRLSGIDAATGECVPICEITRQTTRVGFSQGSVYACGD